MSIKSVNPKAEEQSHFIENEHLNISETDEEILVDTVGPIDASQRSRQSISNYKQLLKRANIYVSLKDPFGRTFKIPYHRCITWEVS